MDVYLQHRVSCCLITAIIIIALSQILCTLQIIPYLICHKTTKWDSTNHKRLYIYIYIYIYISTEKFKGWPRSSHGMWPKEVYFSKVFFAVYTFFIGIFVIGSYLSKKSSKANMTSSCEFFSEWTLQTIIEYICKYLCMHTHTHTHIYIYIYIYWEGEREREREREREGTLLDD